ncbi:hypothetical protein LJC20_05945 [Eubacteriales bacterium OttesenSCG-928-M02]|nr:hypothetical protein [Eubacteriales bacterium OttesenSCG-928-M02]
MWLMLMAGAIAALWAVYRKRRIME